MKKSVERLLKEINELADKKDELEFAFKYEDFKLKLKPFWKTPGFLTFVVAAVSVSITALVGWSQFIHRQSKEVADQEKAFIEKTNEAKKELDLRQQHIQTLMTDTLKLQIQKSSSDLLITMAKMIKLSQELESEKFETLSAQQELSNIQLTIAKQKSQNDSLIAQQERLTASIKTERTQYEALNKNLSDLKNDLAVANSQKEKAELISLLSVLKSHSAQLLAPTKNTFSGKLFPKSAISNEERNLRLTRSKNARDNLADNHLLNEVFLIRPSLKTNFQSMIEEMNAFERTKPNRFLHNTRLYIDGVHPKIDSFIAKIDAVQKQ